MGLLLCGMHLGGDLRRLKMKKIDISPRQAFNIVYHESMLMFQDGGITLPFAADISADGSGSGYAMNERIQIAYKNIMEDFPPDCKRNALVIGGTDSAFNEIAEVMATLGVQQLYICQNGNDIITCFPFITEYNPEISRYYPNAILDYLFLGSASCLSDEDALVDLGITAVVSLLARDIKTPVCISHHVVCEVDDTVEADLHSVFDTTLLFINEAIARGQKVLVHCERGVSRSASVVIAHLLQQRIMTTLDDALRYVQAHRRVARPNMGFMIQLEEFAHVLNSTEVPNQIITTKYAQTTS